MREKYARPLACTSRNRRPFRPGSRRAAAARTPPPTRGGRAAYQATYLIQNRVQLRRVLLTFCIEKFALLQ